MYVYVNYHVKKTSLSKFSGSSLLRFSHKTFPATEKISAECTLVAGILKYRLARFAIKGYWSSHIFYHMSGFSSISIHSLLLYRLTTATTRSNLDFFDLSLQTSAKYSDSLLFIFVGGSSSLIQLLLLIHHLFHHPQSLLLTVAQSLCFHKHIHILLLE